MIIIIFSGAGIVDRVTCSIRKFNLSNTMIVPLWVMLVGYILAFLALYVLPSAWKVRDDNFYQPPIRSPRELESLGVCAHKKVKIQHSRETLRRIEQLQKGNLEALESVELSYITTKCDKNDDVIDDGKETTSASRPPKEHIVLVHGTGMSSTGFIDRIPQEMNATSIENLSLWDLLRQYENEDKYDLTAVDIRGHGLSEITKGPYSVELLAADVAALIRSEFVSSSSKNSPQSKIHCHGLSVGFGICMAMSVYDSDLVHTTSGSGFLFDRTKTDLAAYIFSRELVVRIFGMSALARIGEIVMKASSRGILRKWMSQTHLDGYVHVASEWLNFDLTSHLADYHVPTLFLLTEYDQAIGHTKELTVGEMNMMPHGTATLVEYPGHSHVMLSEKNGARKIAKTVSNYIDEYTLSRSSETE